MITVKAKPRGKDDLEIAESFLEDFDNSESLMDLATACHYQARGMGWWEDLRTGNTERSVGEIYTLIHSEISEAFEGVRKNKKDDHLPQFKNEVVEIADAIIRIMDYAYAAGFVPDLIDAIVAKMNYNRKRPDHQIENRLKKGGKRC